MDNRIYSLIEDTLNFEYITGNMTEIEIPHQTGWRYLDCLLVTQLLGGSVKVLLANGEEYRTKESEAVLIPPGVMHNIILCSPQKAISSWSHTTYTIFGSVDLFSLYDVPLTVKKSISVKLGEVNLELAQIYNTKNPTINDIGRKKEFGFKLLSMVLGLSTQKEHAIEYLNTIQPLVRVMKFIEENLNRDLPVKELSDIANYSESRFNTAFKKAFGVSPSRYIYNLRMKKARLLLAGTAMTIAEISDRIGFSDQFHFSKQFKKIFNVSPLLYRQQIKM